MESTPVIDPEMLPVPPMDPLFLSTPDSISDLDFLFNESIGDLTDFDFDYSDDFDFNFDAEPTAEIPENHDEARNNDLASDSIHSQVSSQGSKTFIPTDTVDAISSPDSTSLHKRKKGDNGAEHRSSKHRKSDDQDNNDDDEKKKKTRLIRNRESAQLSRLRKKQYIDDLQSKVKTMQSTIAELNGKISYVMAENVALRQQMAVANGVPPPMVMNPYMIPSPYQWMPYPVRGYGSNTPLLPIPKLPVTSSCRPKSKGSSSSKSKLKKVASVSFIGILFFTFLFGTLVPFMNDKGENSSGGFSGLSKFEGVRRDYDEHNKGRVLMVGDGKKSHESCVEGEREKTPLRNSSDPLFASLYVPRNEKLVKIDGNLIIHSVLASEKATAFAKKNNTSETLKSKESGALSPALAVPEVRGNGHSTALSSVSSEGKRLQQWFHEGGSGTLMDYNMCTEVFQFDIAPGAIIPSSVSSNVSAEHLQNVTTTHGVKRMKNRRILEKLPVSLLNVTSKDDQNKSVHGNTSKPTSSSSMVVSVLLDPREVVESETDGLIPPNPKSLSRIFVVVLLDSVKYVTYSCVLPRSGLHLVST